MKISPQNFVPYLYANKELDQVKSQGMEPETRLYSNADTYSVELGNQGAPIPVTDSWRSEKGLEVGYQIIESAGFKGFKGGTAWKINSFYLKDLDDRDYSNFATAALNAGEDIDTFVLAAGSIFGESGGNREELSEFLEFSAGLSVADLGNFIQTLHNSPEQREQTMTMASSLETGAVGLYLEGAALAGEELETFNQQVGSLLEGDDPGSLAAYFSAVVAAGDRAAEFVDATHAMGVKDRQTVAEFMNSGLTDQDRDHFLDFLSTSKTGGVTSIIGHAVALDGDDKTNLLKAASQALAHEDAFIRTLDRFEGGELSDFLTTAANAGTALGTLTDLAGEVDLSFTAGLSTVDTVNYLEAAENAGSGLERLTEVAQTLSGQEKSLFLYGAAHSEFDNFLTSVESMKGAERREFITSAASGDQENPDSLVYMKAILSDSDYRDFSLVASELGQGMTELMVDSLAALSHGDRSDFLDAAVAAGEETIPFLSMFNSLSHEDRKNFLGISAELGEDKRAGFVSGALKAGGAVSEFISLAGQMKTDDKSGQVFANFLDAAENASGTGELQNLMGFLGDLTKGQQDVFLQAASQDRFNTDHLIEAGRKMLDKLDTIKANEGNMEAPATFYRMFTNIASGKTGDYQAIVDLWT